jgi:hypothetical protein
MTCGLSSPSALHQPVLNVKLPITRPPQLAESW